LAQTDGDVAREETDRARVLFPDLGSTAGRLLNWLSDRLLRHWVMLAVTGASILALVLGSTALLWREALAARQEEEREVAALARHVAEVENDPLVRGDAGAAREALGTLAASQNVRTAALYGARGDLLMAVPLRGGEAAVPGRAPEPGARRIAGRLESVQSIGRPGRRVGVLYVRADTDMLAARLSRSAPWIASVLLVCVLLALAFGLTLDRRVWRPVLELAGTARAVSRGGDYRLRAPEARIEELRLLTADFNAMVARFEEQERELRATQARLEGLVRKRGDELRLETSERRRAEDHSYLLSQALETSQDLVSIADLDDRFTYVNRAFLDAYGYEEAEVLGRGVRLIDSPNNPAGLRERISEGTAAGGWHGELLNRRKGGREFPIALSTSLVRDEAGRVVGYLGVASDIGQRRAAEERVCLLRAALEAAVDSVVITDAAGRIEWVNPGFTRLTGYATDEVVGLLVTRLSGESQDEAYPEGFWATLREGKVWKGEIIRRRRDGTRYHEELTVTPVRDERGRVAHYVGIQRDISERRRLEAQVRQATKMEAVGRLAGGVAHDFNNLLGVIRGHGELAQAQLEPEAPGRDRIDEILAAAGRAATLTQQLLAFSRKQVMEPKVLDLNGVVSGVRSLLRPLVGEDIEVEVQLAEALGRVKADPNQIDQVLMNLAANARDAMPHGGRLTLGTRNVELDDAFCQDHPGARPGRHVALLVGDTGIGIDAATLAHVFEPFFTTKQMGKGTGLGLATVYGIVKQSDGYVWVDSELGRGTTVTVYLPRVEADVAAAPAPRKHTAAGRGETVLLVEDEDCLRPLAAELLGSCGYQVLTARSGSEALTQARTHDGEIALLLTDVVMPGMSGPQLASALRERHPSLRVLYMSGYLADTMAQHGILEEGMLLLNKPFSSVELTEKVREALADPVPSPAAPGA
jgi:PAS domain S-box-containing protein